MFKAGRTLPDCALPSKSDRCGPLHDAIASNMFLRRGEGGVERALDVPGNATCLLTRPWPQSRLDQRPGRWFTFCLLFWKLTSADILSLIRDCPENSFLPQADVFWGGFFFFGPVM